MPDPFVALSALHLSTRSVAVHLRRDRACIAATMAAALSTQCSTVRAVVRAQASGRAAFSSKSTFTGTSLRAAVPTQGRGHRVVTTAKVRLPCSTPLQLAATSQDHHLLLPVLACRSLDSLPRIGCVWFSIWPLRERPFERGLQPPCAMGCTGAEGGLAVQTCRSSLTRLVPTTPLRW
jgi:hypothetical protein